MSRRAPTRPKRRPRRHAARKPGPKQPPVHHTVVLTTRHMVNLLLDDEVVRVHGIEVRHVSDPNVRAIVAQRGGLAERVMLTDADLATLSRGLPLRLPDADVRYAADGDPGILKAVLRATRPTP